MADEEQTTKQGDPDNDQPFIPLAEGHEHGYWGQRARNTVPNEEMTVAGVTGGTANVSDKPDAGASQRRETDTKSLRGGKS